MIEPFPAIRRIASATTSALAALTLLAFADACARGLPPARSAAFSVLVLGLPAAATALAAARIDSRHPGLSAAAAAATLFVLAEHALPLHVRWLVLAPSRRSLPAEVALFALGAAAAFLLRAAGARLTRGLEPGFRRCGAVSAAGTAAVVLAVGFAPPPPPAPLPPPPAGRPNVLLVTVDTLRADHLSAYGYRAHRTPNVDRLAAEGVRFEDAHATAPWTLPSLASILTGRYPSVLGIERRERAVPRDVPTLAEAFSTAGFETRAIVANLFTMRKFGLQRGFRAYEHLYDVGPGFEELTRHPLHWLAWKATYKLLGDDAGRLTDRAIAWLEHREDPNRPFFLWLHYVDPHEPYGGPHARRDLPCGSREAPEIGSFFAGQKRIREGRYDPPPAVREHLVHLYDSDVRHFDRHFGRLLDALDRLDLSGGTLLVLTADHGEEFWDHGGFEHGHTVYPELTRVPLVARWPGTLPAGQVRRRPVSLIGLGAALLAAAGVPVPPGFAPPIPHDAEPPDGAEVFSENTYYGPERKALRDSRHSVLFDSASERLVAFDRRADPGEHSPIDLAAAAPLPEHFSALLERHQALAAARAKTAERLHLTESEREQLRSLGYVE